MTRAVKDTFHADFGIQDSEKDQIGMVHGHANTRRKTIPRRIGFRIFFDSRAGAFQFRYEGCRAGRVIASDIVSDIFEIGGRLRTEANGDHLFRCGFRVFRAKARKNRRGVDGRAAVDPFLNQTL